MRDEPTPAEEAWALLERLLVPQRLRFLEIAAELGLHPAQQGALMALEEGVSLPMHELATRLHCDSSNVTGIVDRLEQRGLVERRPHDQDRRVKLIVLTARGAEVRHGVRRRMREVPAVLLAMRPEDQSALRDIMRRAFGHSAAVSITDWDMPVAQ
jgi:DNA-binding MarR family transcriptional regulator